jgi:uncharacterized membrane protein
VLPGAQLLEITHRGFVETELRRTRHFELYRAFVRDPEAFIAQSLAEEEEEEDEDEDGDLDEDEGE